MTRGNVYLLYENEAGWYETEEKDLKGIPGNTYTLMVTTPGWEAVRVLTGIDAGRT